MKRVRDIFFVLIAVMSGFFFGGTELKPQVPTYIRPDHARIIETWLREHDAYRVADDSNCNCEEDIANMRRGYGGKWKAIPDYHPYYVVGDLNGDGKEDFAIAVLGGRESKEFAVVIFNGPLTSRPIGKAAYFGSKFLLGNAMFYGPPRPKPYMLIVGPFESEGVVIKPKADGYLSE